MSFTDLHDRRQMERAEDWDGWCKRMPKITVPEGCQIMVIPPNVGAIVRFVIYKGEKYVSVYFDAFSRLGYCNGPYWEAYPVEGDNRRYAPEDWEPMMADIARELGKP